MLLKQLDKKNKLQYLSHFIHKNLMWVTDVSIKFLTIKISEENLRENLYDFRVHRNLLDKTRKV